MTCYIKFEGEEPVGILKVGPKQLFVAPPSGGSLVKIQPLSVLDFFVVKQRGGIGKRIFDYMLQSEDVEPRFLAYDRPSPKLLGFLKKYFGLRSFTPQAVNFVVFHEYFEAKAHQSVTGRESDTTKVLERAPTARSKENARPDFRIRRSTLYY